MPQLTGGLPFPLFYTMSPGLNSTVHILQQAPFCVACGMIMVALTCFGHAFPRPHGFEGHLRPHLSALELPAS